MNNTELYCIGCGAIIQTENPNQSGYVPSSALENRADDDLYCKRCFRLRHYNEVADVELTSDDFLDMLNDISNQNALIINVVDIFDFNGSIIPGIERFAGSNPVMIVGNKVDILPKSLKRPRLRQWLTERVHELGLRPVEIELVSAIQANSVEALMEKINFHRKGKDVYVVGTTNVGKSTLINQIINLSTDIKDVVTTSYFPGTTLGKIEIPLDDGNVLVDTPGIFQQGQLVHLLDNKSLKVVTPRKELKPRNYQLNPGQTMFFGGLARFDYTKGQDKESFVVYASNELEVHRTKMKKATDLYQNQVGKLLTPPYQSDERISHMKKATFKVKEPSDIVFSGLGWVKVNASNVEVDAYAPEGVDVFIRQSLI